MNIQIEYEKDQWVATGEVIISTVLIYEGQAVLSLRSMSMINEKTREHRIWLNNMPVADGKKISISIENCLPTPPAAVELEDTMLTDAKHKAYCEKVAEQEN